MITDPRVLEFVAVPPGPDARADVARLRKELEDNGLGWWVVELKATREFAGLVALQNVSFRAAFTPAHEFGLCFRSELWGHGYAGESAAAMLGFAHEMLGWKAVVAFTSAANVRARRVMERLGMTHDPREDFDHPLLDARHPLRRHVLYRKQL
jgi:RimJ/RimL family protein N-acetyltransferase